jgi:hypothetical protein
VSLSDGTQEYDLEVAISDADYLWIAKQGVEVKVAPSSGDPEYYAGRDLPRRDIPWLDRHIPNWRNHTGRPEAHYLREVGGQVFFGIYPTPEVGSGETWTARVPYVIRATEMSADGDEPFTVSSNVKKVLSPWHEAIADRAASELENLRKNATRSLELLQYAQARVKDYQKKQRPRGGRMVNFARDYRAHSHASLAEEPEIASS